MSATVEDEGIEPELEADFRESVRDFVDHVMPLAATRAMVDEGRGYDRSAWRRAVSELQVVSIGVPESLGGEGGGLPFAGVVFEEFGRSLVPGPLFATAGLAASVLTRLGAQEHLTPLLDGTATATVAWVGASGSWDPVDTPARVRISGDRAVVNGELRHVVDGHTADTIFVVARDEDERVVLVALPADAPGVRAVAVETLDLTRPLARVDVVEAQATVVGAGAEAIAAGLADATVLLCLESAGAARRALELTVEYAKIRHQFGRPIGSFQAIKHKCADMLARVELMAAVAREAASRREDLPHVAKAYVSDAFFAVASEAVQVHGGIGFTWEHDSHLFFRRAKSSQLLLGDAVMHRAALARAEGWGA
ncbi:acyl-CoA dehydrogenase family protein [Microbacterium sp. RD1]|uniref:acyl-CoA dehydrogenase family protein n=1 Tax=Microbacterium sp. RD1 TaxID=3457313 RepID=UPI003FA580DC